jgi:mercuric ion transport protein
MIERVTGSRSAGIVGIASAAAVGLLPKLTCPLCWPAYAAALSALGLSFMDYALYLLPLTALFVAMSIGALAWTARARQTVAPLLVGALAGPGLLAAKFALESDALTYTAAGLLVIAAFLPRRRPAQAACPNCVSMPAKEIT